MNHYVPDSVVEFRRISRIITVNEISSYGCENKFFKSIIEDMLHICHSIENNKSHVVYIRQFTLR